MTQRPEPREAVTALLLEWRHGDKDALDRLVPLVYEELRRVARARLKADRGHSLQTTALVHEAYVRLVDLDRMTINSRAHFFAVAARLMRRILIDYARARKREKRGGEMIQVPLAEGLVAPVERVEALVALDEALTRLEARNPRQSRVVECRCFAGMSVEETAAALGASPATVKRDWAFWRAWLNRELGQDGDGLTTTDGSVGS